MGEEEAVEVEVGVEVDAVAVEVGEVVEAEGATEETPTTIDLGTGEAGTGGGSDP